MKLERLPHDPGQLLEFYEDGLSSLGALCERTWHDRLHVVAQGGAAQIWNEDGALHETELLFTSADTAAARNAAREVFPGCPLTFQLAESLRAAPIPLERFVLPAANASRPPEPAVGEKLWRAQFSDTGRWRLLAPMQSAFHFTLAALVRSEIQAIDQHWSLHRIAISLSDGQPDEALAGELSFYENSSERSGGVEWPAANPIAWQNWLQAALEKDLGHDLEAVCARQQSSLQRELERIDEYFDHYEVELTARARRTSREGSRLKTEDRLAAARAEHQRRRADQLARHEIRIHLHIEGFLVIAEEAWRARLEADRNRHSATFEALYVPRSRQWKSPAETIAHEKKTSFGTAP